MKDDVLEKEKKKREKILTEALRKISLKITENTLIKLESSSR